MKIAIVSKADETAGGASRVAADLTRGVGALGHDVSHFVAWADRACEKPVKFAYGPPFLRRVTLTMGKVSRRFGFAETLPIELPLSFSQLRRFDVVHFHDTSSSFSPLTLLAVAKATRVAWTFHDCSPFTGGCIYPQIASCDRYKEGCGSCPLSGEWPLDGLLDTTRVAHAARRLLHRHGGIRYVAPSSWMADTAFSSGMLFERPTVISNMVDTERFKPAGNLKALRRKLGIDDDRLVLSMSAGNISDPRKNVRGTLEALKAVSARGERPIAVIIGNPDPRIGDALEGIDFISTGFVSDRGELAEWLAASDAFVTTSRADNQPLAVMEAMACGTPVYGWPVGGVGEMIKDGSNGRAIQSQKPDELGSILVADLTSGHLVAMRHETRRHAVLSYSASAFASNHVEFYKSMLSNNKDNT